jgi:hypothetical protein
VFGDKAGGPTEHAEHSEDGLLRGPSAGLNLLCLLGLLWLLWLDGKPRVDLLARAPWSEPG